MPTLPEELLALIIEQLASPDVFQVGEMLDDDTARPCKDDIVPDYSARISTLTNICLASKAMHRLAWPVLYRDHYNHRFDDAHVDSDSDPPSAKLLRTICLKPHYGLAVRNLLIDAWTPVEAMHGEQLFELLQGDATVTALFQWRARGFWYDDAGSNDFLSMLNRSLSLGHEDAIITLLLILCPNIRELDIEPPIEFGTSLFVSLLELASDRSFQAKPLPEPEYDFEQEEADYVIAQMFGTPWPDQKLQKPMVLQALAKLTLRDPGLSEMDFEFFGQLLALPSLLTLKVYGVVYQGNYKTTQDALALHGRNSKLQILELLQCQATGHEISAVVECCPKLEELAVVWDDFSSTFAPDDIDDAPFMLGYGVIADAAVKHAPNLRKLTMDGHDWPNDGAKPTHPFIVEGRLDSLKHLVHLKLDDRAIYGPQKGTSWSSLGAVVPKGVMSLKVISEDPPDRGSPSQDKSWLQWQDDDLSAFLRDRTFDRLLTIELEGRSRRHCWDAHAAEKHGWEVTQWRDTTRISFVNATRPFSESAASIRHSEEV